MLGRWLGGILSVLILVGAGIMLVKLGRGSRRPGAGKPASVGPERVPAPAPLPLPRARPSGGRRWRVAGAAVVALLIAGAAVVSVRLLRGAADDVPVATDSVVVTTGSAGPFAGIPVPLPTASAEPEPQEEAVEEAPVAAEPALPLPSEDATLVRLVIPKAKVNHRFVIKGLNERREMEEPGGKDDVAWYNFSTRPGFGSNAVLSGHVDWYTGDLGVFWFLRDLREGDEAEVHYSDGMVLKYRVFRVEVYGTGDAPVAEITGPTDKDQLTMITCDGVFQRSTRDYTQRRVVFAERIA